MATTEERVSFIEGKLDQFATKSDIADMELRLTIRLGALIVLGFGTVIAVLRLWQ